jgi:3-oxoacyl-[acyl-carrier protein] reductase
MECALPKAVCPYTQAGANPISLSSIEFPGGTWAPAKASNPDLYGRVLGSILFGRLGRPEEVAQVAPFSCSALASWVTGRDYRR